MNQLDLINIYRILPVTLEYTVLKTVHEKITK